MAFEPAIAAALSDQVVQSVFKVILKNRSVLFKEIRRSVIDASGVDQAVIDPKIEAAVQTLKNEGLIKERPAGIGDFNTYIITANGLGAERELRFAEGIPAQT